MFKKKPPIGQAQAKPQPRTTYSHYFVCVNCECGNYHNIPLGVKWASLQQQLLCPNCLCKFK